MREGEREMGRERERWRQREREGEREMETERERWRQRERDGEREREKERERAREKTETGAGTSHGGLLSGRRVRRHEHPCCHVKWLFRVLPSGPVGTASGISDLPACSPSIHHSRGDS